LLTYFQVQHPKVAAQIDDFIVKLKDLLLLEEPFDLVSTVFIIRLCKRLWEFYFVFLYHKQSTFNQTISL